MSKNEHVFSSLTLLQAGKRCWGGGGENRYYELWANLVMCMVQHLIIALCVSNYYATTLGAEVKCQGHSQDRAAICKTKNKQKQLLSPFPAGLLFS